MLFSKHFEAGGHAVHLVHAGRSTLPGVPPEVSRGGRVIFLHGAGSNAGVWHRQLDRLAGRRSPIAIDLPGHGRSSGTEALPSVEAYGAVVRALLERLESPPAVWIGSSMGGLVALDVALRAPDRVRGLVLVGAAARIAVPPDRIDAWRRVMLGREPQPFTPYGYGPDTPFEVLREGWEQQVKTDPRVRYGDLIATAAADYSSRISEIAAPTLFVRGEHDPLVSAADVERAAAALRRSRRVEIPGAGHYSYRERPEEFGAAIDGFLEEIA